MSSILLEQDKAILRVIVQKTHSDLKFINMEYIYSEIEKLISTPDFKIYLAHIQDDEEVSEDDEYIASDFEFELLDILLCSLNIQQDLGDEKQDILEAVKEWLLEYSSRDSEKDGDNTKDD